MASVYIEKRKPKNSKGKISYRVLYKDPLTFRSKYYQTFHKYKEAQKAKNHLENLIDNNRFSEVKKHRRKIQPLRFAEIGNLLIQDWNKKLDRKELSQDTFEGYTLRLNVLNREFGKQLVVEFSKKDISEYHQMVFNKSSPASANRYLFIIKQVFKKAVSVGVIIEDPTADIKYLSEKQHERNNFLMPVDLVKLVAASQKTRAKFYMPALIYLGAEHASSKQEALSLKWSDINFEAEGIGLINLFRTKNSNERTEFLMPNTKKALLDWKAHLNYMRHRKKIKVKNDRFVFSRLDGTPIKRFNKAWNRICEIAGFEDFNYHDLRHTFCSNLLMSGADLKETKDMIGHKDLSMTDRYTHLNALHKKSLQDQLAKRYAQAQA